jgi:Conserved TM helix
MVGVIAQVDLEGGLESAWESIITFLPKLGGFLLILLIGYFVAKAIEKILDRILERVGFDRLVERGGVRKALERSKYDASDILSRIVFYIIFLFVLQLAFGVFGPNPISDLIEGIIAFLPNLFVAIVIIVITAAVATGVGNVVGSTLSGLSYGRTLAMIASAAIWVVGITAALTQINVAEPIVTGIFYALLALVVGVGVVAIGGGGIEPMRERWKRALNRVDQEAPQVREEARGMGDEARRQGEEVRREAATEPTPEQLSQPAEPYTPESDTTTRSEYPPPEPPRERG